MKPFIANVSRYVIVVLTSIFLMTPGLSHAKGINEEPSAGAMVLDAVVARPVGVVTTILGAGLYIVTLPFTLAGGNAEEAGKALVVGPAKNTFVRCLGCKRTGYQK